MANILKIPVVVATKDWILKYRMFLAVAGGVGIGVIGGKSIFQPNPEPPPIFEERVHELEIESLRGIASFNSPDYDSLVAMGDTNAGKLKVRLKEPNRQYLLTLLALRAVSPDSYRDVRATLKTGILIDALNQATYFNAWGIPHRYWTEPDANTPALPDTTRLEEPVDAIIELGEAAKPFLVDLLTENRSAPRWGSGEGFEGQGTNEYRVADYALALIRRIEGKDFPETRAARDSLIQEYLGQVVVN